MVVLFFLLFLFFETTFLYDKKFIKSLKQSNYFLSDQNQYNHSYQQNNISQQQERQETNITIHKRQFNISQQQERQETNIRIHRRQFNISQQQERQESEKYKYILAWCDVFGTLNYYLKLTSTAILRQSWWTVFNTYLRILGLL